MPTELNLEWSRRPGTRMVYGNRPRDTKSPKSSLSTGPGQCASYACGLASTQLFLCPAVKNLCFREQASGGRRCEYIARVFVFELGLHDGTVGPQHLLRYFFVTSNNKRCASACCSLEELTSPRWMVIASLALMTRE
jgi:hypothetical protein